MLLEVPAKTLGHQVGNVGYCFEGDTFEPIQERGLDKLFRNGKLIEMVPNGRERLSFKLWSGFKEWEKFEEGIVKDVSDK